MVLAREGLGDGVERPVADAHPAPRIGLQVPRPGRLGRTGRDEDGAGRVGRVVLDEPDGHGAGRAALGAEHLDPGEAARRDEVVLHRVVAAGAQDRRRQLVADSSGSGDSDASGDSDGSGDPDASAEPDGDGSTEADGAADGDGEGAGDALGAALAGCEAAAEGAADAAADGALDRVGPSVQPAPVVGVEQAPTRIATRAAEASAAASRRVRSAVDEVAGIIGSAAPLPGLAFGLGGRRVDHLDPLHVADRPGAERRHRLAERADQVLRAVGHVGRTEQDPLQRADGPDLDPRAARQRG